MSYMRKLSEEVRTRDGEMRKPIPMASEESSMLFDSFYLDFIHPIELKGKVFYLAGLPLATLLDLVARTVVRFFVPNDVTA
jgi:hypothetical protein